MEDMLLMSRNQCVAKIIDRDLHPLQSELLPLFLQRTGDVMAWLEMRAIDSHRTNSRLLKRALRLENKDDLHTVLAVNAVTITDSYWVKPINSPVQYQNVRFQTNMFDKLALRGDVNSFNQHPSRTPELTNIGSFEKCWRLIDGQWWLYKDGNPQERFSELLAYHIGRFLHFSIAEYEADEEYIRSRDFTHNASVNFEPIIGLVDDCSDYRKVDQALQRISADEDTKAKIRRQYRQLCYFDALIFNMDRHEQNFGLLREPDTGKILALAPLFDHNIALISRGYPRDMDCRDDLLIHDFTELVQAEGSALTVSRLTTDVLESMIRAIPIRLSVTEEVPRPKEFLVRYLLNRQQRIADENRNILKWKNRTELCR